jgi:hypothetical protein
MDLDMRESLRNFPQVRIEAIVSAPILPGGRDLPICVSEDRAEPVFYPDRIAILLFDGLYAGLRCVGPDAQEVREIRDLN